MEGTVCTLFDCGLLALMRNDSTLFTVLQQPQIFQLVQLLQILPSLLPVLPVFLQTTTTTNANKNSVTSTVFTVIVFTATTFVIPAINVTAVKYIQ